MAAMDLIDQSGPQYSPLVQNGTQDWKNKPANKLSTGGIKACGFIIAEEVVDRVSFDGVSASLVTYLTSEMGQSNASASVTVNQWNGTAFLTSILGGFVADAYLGRFKTIVLFSTVYLIALTLLTVEVSVVNLKPCTIGGGECSKLHTGLFYFAIYLAAVAAGGSKPCASAFGGDQFDETEMGDKIRKASFFNWWFFAQSSANVAAVTAIVAIQLNVGWGWGYGIPTSLLALGLLLFVCGAPFYRYSPVLGSPLTQVARVLVASTLNWRLPLSDHGLLYEGDEIELSKQGKNKLSHTNQFRCLDKAAMIISADKQANIEYAGTDNNVIISGTLSRWRLCSVTEVEEVKLIVRTIPIWLSLIPFSIATAQTHSLFIRQGSTLDRMLGASKAEIPSASVAVFMTLSMAIVLPLYDRLLVPLTRKYTGHHRGITLLQRMGTGILIGVVGMVTAATVEKKRLNAAASDGLLHKPRATIAMSVFWLVPQYSILGIAESFTSIGRLEFFYDQAPDSLRSLGSAMYLSSVGVANFLSSALITIINLATKHNHGGPWIGPNLNTSHVDYFYWLLAALCFVEFWIYCGLAHWYRYKSGPDSNDNLSLIPSPQDPKKA